MVEHAVGLRVPAPWPVAAKLEHFRQHQLDCRRVEIEAGLPAGSVDSSVTFAENKAPRHSRAYYAALKALRGGKSKKGEQA